MEGRVEFKANSVNLLFKPFAGVMVNTNDAKHLYVNAYYEISVTKMFSIVPSFAPGIYYKGKSKDLHFILEFRSQVELLLDLQNQIKAGISFNHISNASLGSLNPGVESLALTFQFPVF